MRVLIIVDMIKAFLHERTKNGPCGLYVKDATSIIPNIVREMATAGEIIFVCDMHEPNDKEFNSKWGKHAIANTEESEVVDELMQPSLPKHPYLIGKQRFSGFYNTALGRILKEMDPDEVVIAGAFTDICVFATALDACYRDYKVTIIKDCVYPVFPQRGEIMLKYLTEMFANITVKEGTA